FIYSNKKPIGIFFIEIYKRKFVSYGYIPSGIHVIDSRFLNKEKLFKELNVFLKSFCREKKISAVRFDLLDKGIDPKLLERSGFLKSLAPGLPRYFWEIDLTKSVEDLRHDMSKSTRYNINKGERSHLQVVKAKSMDDVEEFYKLLSDTTERKRFLNFQEDYFLLQFHELHSIGMMDIYIVKYIDKYISGALINFYKDKAYYTHGASTSNIVLAKLRSPYFLQWKIMTELKEKGFKTYNMWGVLGDDDSKGGLKGVSDFKKSFGGNLVPSFGVWEVYSNPIKYSLHRLYDLWVYRNERY